MRISYSSLEAYQSCPLKYKFQEIDKIRAPKSKEAVFGSTIHSTMKFIHTPGILSPALEQALEFFSNAWNSSVFENEDEERSAFSQGVRMIQEYYKKNNIAAANIVDLESYFQIEIGEKDNPHIVSGRIDRIDKTDGGYEIIDYKTAKKMPSQEKVHADLQLSIYLKAFLTRYPEELGHLDTLKVSLYFLKHGVKLSSRRTAEQLAKSEEVFLTTIQEIEEKKQTGNFEPVVSPLCDWCGYQKMCPMWKHKFKELRHINTEEVNQAIGEYIDLQSAVSLTKARLGELQEIIRDYMKQEGVDRVFSPNGIIAKALRKTYGYDREQLRSILAPLGKWETVLKIDGTALKNIFTSLPYEVKRAIEETKKLEKETESLVVKKEK